MILERGFHLSARVEPARLRRHPAAVRHAGQCADGAAQRRLLPALRRRDGGRRPPRERPSARGSYLFLCRTPRTPGNRARRYYARMRTIGVAVDKLGRDEMGQLVGMNVEDLWNSVSSDQGGYGDPIGVLAGFRARAESLGIAFRGATSSPSTCGTDGSPACGAEGGHSRPTASSARPVPSRSAWASWPERPFPCPRPPAARASRPAAALELGVPRGHRSDRRALAQRGGQRHRHPADRHRRPSPRTSRPTAEPARLVAAHLTRRVPALAGLQAIQARAGLYEMTADHNRILGEHPGAARFSSSPCGFSGHGLMMAPATGEIVADLTCSAALPSSTSAR